MIVYRYWFKLFPANKPPFSLHLWFPIAFLSFSCALVWASVGVAVAAPGERQSHLFVNNCAQCHAREETGAPFIGVQADWQEAVARGEDAMLINVVEGIRGMPPLGYCSACTEQDFRVLIRMMAGLPDSTVTGEEEKL